MKFAVVSSNRKSLEGELKKAGFRLDSRRPDFVLCVGGDGTFLWGEETYPGVPKVFVKHRCHGNCKRHGLSRICRMLEKGEYRVKKVMKVQGTINRNLRTQLTGLNEINVHYRLPCALGLDVWINGKRFGSVLGDGIIASTPYGSTGYFSSITRKSFSKGIGLAFNNPVRRNKHKVLSEGSDIRLRVVKGAGWMSSDCSRKVYPLKIGDTVEIIKSPQHANIVVLKGMKEKIVK